MNKKYDIHQSGGKMRILMTIGRLNIGGAERRLLQLVRYINHQSLPIHITFYVISGRKGHLDSEFNAAGAHIIYGQPSLRGLFEFSRIARKLNPDLIHVNAGSAGGFYCLAGRLGGVQHTISHIRSCGPLNRSIFSRHALVYEPCTSFFSSIVLGVSSATKENRNFANNNWRVIFDGIDYSEIANLENSHKPDRYSSIGPNFLILGRLDRLKNIPHAIRSFARFVRELNHPHACLHVVGPEGNQSIDELYQIAQQENILSQVHFHGPTDEPLRYFKHADCALLCSDYEGLPGSALESLATGTPVVASDISPSREVAKFTSGIFVVPVSDIKGWIDSMASALNADRNKIAKNFWDNSPFPLKHHVDALIALWCELSNKII